MPKYNECSIYDGACRNGTCTHKSAAMKEPMNDEHPSYAIMNDYRAAMDMSNPDAIGAIDRYKIITRAYSRGLISFKRMNESIAFIANAYLALEN